MALSVTNLGIDGLEAVEQIGTGGSSRVYRARQVDLDRVVAVKVLNPGDDQGVAKRFDRERKAMGRLSLHEGIVPVYSSGTTRNGEPYLVMPYYPNGSLQDQIDAGPMEWQTAVTYVDVAAETIAAAHAEGVVHLDLKPANILLTNTGAPRIADFGIAQLLGSATAGITAGTAFTPAYSAPETFLDGETGPASDVYGLGATLWALLVGHPPFLTPGDDTNLMAVIGRVVNNHVGDLRHLAPTPICDVIERAMSKRPQDRYQTAREFSLALKQAAAAASSPPPAPAIGSAFFPPDVTAHDPAGRAAPPAADPSPVTQASGPPTIGVPAPEARPEPPNPAPVPNRAPDPSPAPATTTVGAPGPIGHGRGHSPGPQPVEPIGANRPLLQDVAQPFPAPVSPPAGGLTSTPFVDLDRFRLGPVLIGAISFLLIVGAAVWAFSRQPGGETASEVGEQTLEPGSPTTAAAGAITVEGASSLVETTAALDADDASSTSLTATSSAPVTTTGVTSTPTSDATTTSEASTSTSESTSSTSSTTTSTTTTTTTTTVLPGPPQAPTGLTAVTGVGTNVRLNWDAPASGPTPAGYTVLRNGEVIADDLVTTIYLDADPEPGTYLYTVRAKGADGSTSPNSNTITINVGPVEITQFTVGERRAQRVSVSFAANKCVSYRASAVSIGGDDPPPVISEAGQCTDSDSFFITGLDRSTDYTINLIVRTADGETDSDQLPAPALGAD